MSITAVCGCGQSYSLKDEFANKAIKCPACGDTFTVPASSRIAQAEPIFDRDKFLIRQKRIAISTKYFVGDEQGGEIAFVHRPAAVGQVLLFMCAVMAWVLITIFGLIALFGDNNNHAAGAIIGLLMPIIVIAGVIVIAYALAPVRHVTFYRDQNMREPLMVVQQGFKMAFLNARYPLVDAAGAPLAVLRKNYLYNFIRKRWYVDAPDGTPICIALEDSIVLSILRRFIGPLFGLLRTNFMIMSPDLQTVIGEFNRKLTIFDKYVLDLTHDPDRTFDRRVALALGVMLDTGERR